MDAGSLVAVAAVSPGATTSVHEGDGYRPQIGQPGEEELQSFGHHAACALHTVPDEVLVQVRATATNPQGCCLVDCGLH